MTLEQWLKKSDVSQLEFAKALGTTRQALNHWISGKSKPKVYFALAVQTLTGGAVPLTSWLTPMQALALKGMEARAAVPQQ